MENNPVWATSRYSEDECYKRWIREFLMWDVLRSEPFTIEPREDNALIRLNEFRPIVTHWSRLFEYPWAMEAADLKKTDVVLDAGGGNGLIQYAAAYRSREVVNVDIAMGHIRSVDGGFLRSYVKNLALEHGNISALRYQDNWFDKVFCVSVLEHVTDPRKILGELVRVTKPGGRIIVTVDVIENGAEDSLFVLKTIGEFLKEYGLSIPGRPWNVLRRAMPVRLSFPETYNDMSVLCFYVDKILSAWRNV